MTSANYVEVLLVEDSANDAELALMALEEEKLSNHVVWLRDGAEALDFLFGTGKYEGRNLSNLPKVILLDLKMPKVGGIEVIKKLKADERTKKIPVVIMTSSKEESDIVESYKLGASSYVVKPLDFDQFNKAVKDIGYYWLLINETHTK